MSNKLAIPATPVSIESGLASPGDTVSVCDRLAIDSFEMGGRTFELACGLSYDVALTNTGDGILAAGIVRGEATTACDRCLAPTAVSIAGELSCYFLKEEPEEDSADDQDFGLIDEATGTVDLAEAIQGAVAMDVPFVVLCADDCRGLCPTCGANLNEGDCGCAPAEPDSDFERPNPFAALAGFTFADGTTVADHAAELDQPDDDAIEDELSDEEFERLWEERERAEHPDPAESE
jgi:uncharacterized protein